MSQSVCQSVSLSVSTRNQFISKSLLKGPGIVITGPGDRGGKRIGPVNGDITRGYATLIQNEAGRRNGLSRRPGLLDKSSSLSALSPCHTLPD